MSDFFKKFLLEDPRRLNPAGRYVGLAAFGKHPGWDDHVEDLGLETDSLNLAKTVIYINGIGGQIDSGAWEKLDAAQQLPGFKHLFQWQRSGQMLIGRLWSSSDGKGRTRYPMVVCLHFAGVTLGWALKHALPALAEIEQACVKTTSAEEVRSLLNRKRAALRDRIQSADAARSGSEFAPLAPESLQQILPPAADNARREGFLRVLYQLQSQLGAFAVSKFNPTRRDQTAIRAQQIRVPAVGQDPDQTLLFWTRFFLTQVDSSVPLLLTLPLEAEWVDVTAGEPESHEFFCLRASPRAVPLVSDVPYKLDDAFRAKATAFLDAFARGETKAADLQPAPAVVPAAETTTPTRRGWLKWLGVGAVLVLAVAGAVVVFTKGARLQSSTNPSDNKPGGDSQMASNGLSTLNIRHPSPSGSAPTPKAVADAATPTKPRIDPEAEAARLAEEQKKSNALAAAATLKEETEAAAKEKERQLAKEKEAAMQKELQEQQRKATEATLSKAAGDDQPKPPIELAAALGGTSKAAEPKSATASAPSAWSTRGETTNSIGMVLVPLPSGIWVSKYEITQAEYQKVIGSNPSKSVNERQPVEQVAWNEANEFCRKLTELERGQLPPGKAYSLPTVKQWEEFRGGQRFEDLPGRGVTFKGNPALVGQSGPANKFGLFDVLGNVWEWCLDGATGEEKLLKGGAFNSPKYDQTLLADKQMPNCGFRCVLAEPNHPKQEPNP